MIRYWLVLICSFLWQRIPTKAGYALASFIADVTFLVWRRGRQNILDNMCHVLGQGIDPKEIERTGRESLRNYFKYMVDFLRFPKISREEIERSVITYGWENIDRALKAGRGVIFIGLHMGNWDLGAAAIALKNYKLSVIAETFSPPKLNEFVQRNRIQKGMNVIPMESAARKVLEALRRNEIVGLLIDRPMQGEGVPVEFFGAQTYIPRGAASLALKTGAYVVPAAMVRQPDNSFIALVDHHLDFEPDGDRRLDEQALSQRIISSLEAIIRQHPEQWYMFRRMWEDGSVTSSTDVSSIGKAELQG